MPESAPVTLADLLDAAQGRTVWGIDARGHGGRVTAGIRVTDGWRVPVKELTLACIEGERWQRLTTPT